MTGQTLLNYMELVNQELQLQAAETDVVRGLLALNVAQDYFESVAATIRGFKGDTTGTLTTSASTETTAFPSGVKRIDSIWFIDPTTSKPLYELDEIQETGGHVVGRRWPTYLFTRSNPGRPVAFWTNGTNIYWDPLPDATYSLRWYGFQSVTDITAGGTFLYDDALAFPIASFATGLMSTGVGDDPAALQALANSTFAPIITSLSNFTRVGPPQYRYRYRHST